MASIVVVGAGIIGSCCAVALAEAGHRVRVVADAVGTSTTSAVAAAVWFPTHVGPPDRVDRWGASTFEVLAAQARSGSPGVVMLESLGLYREAPETPRWASAVGGVRNADRDELPNGYHHGLRFAVPMAEMHRYLPWLVSRIRSLGGSFERRHLSSLVEVGHDADVVVNCTGLGARELVADRTVHPVRGQVVRVTNPGLHMSIRDEDHPDGRAYVHPRTRDCILGGTLDVDRWDTAVDPATSEAIVSRCLELAPALRHAEVLEHRVGLRPGRPTVRLEEDTPLNGGARVVHCYGHGGAGITLSWGCAAEIVEIVGRGGST